MVSSTLKNLLMQKCQKQYCCNTWRIVKIHFKFKTKLSIKKRKIKEKNSNSRAVQYFLDKVF